MIFIILEKVGILRLDLTGKIMIDIKMHGISAIHNPSELPLEMKINKYEKSYKESQTTYYPKLQSIKLASRIDPGSGLGKISIK